MAIEALDYTPLIEGRYAALFNVTPETRHTLFEPSSRLLLIQLYAQHRALYAQLQDHWRSIKLRNIAEIDKMVSTQTKEALKKLRIVGATRGHDEPFELGANGGVLPSHGNAMLALKKLGVTLRYDLFANVIYQEGLEGFERTLDDHGLRRLWTLCESEFGFRVPKRTFDDWVIDKAMHLKYHPVRDYLDGLLWDGKPRIDRWLVHYMGAADNEYVRAVGAIWFIAAVRRIKQPGCKFDEMLVLESPQGMSKSSALAVLAGNEDWFSDSLHLDAGDKEMIEASSGCWIVEIGELQGMRKADVEKMKATLSRQADRARLAYDRLPVKRKRQFIIAGTTNGGEERPYLQDATGNRRFWPVKVTKEVDVLELEIDRDQLWAEAVHREKAGESIRLRRDLWPAAAAEQAARTQVNQFEEALAGMLEDFPEGTWARTDDLWNALNIPLVARRQYLQPFGDALAALGWKKVKPRVPGERYPQWAYVKGQVDRTSQIVCRELGLEYADEVEARRKREETELA